MTKEQLLKIMEEVRPDVDFTNEERLVDKGIIDSFDIITMVSMIGEQYGVEIGVKNLIPGNFNSVNALFSLIDKLQGSKS